MPFVVCLFVVFVLMYEVVVVNTVLTVSSVFVVDVSESISAMGYRRQ
jgi:hypothetical protein